MLAFDEINKLVDANGYRSIDIDKYFDEMDLPESEKEVRKDFAREFQEDMFVILSFLYLIIENGWTNQIQTAKNRLRDAFLRIVNEYTVPDSFLLSYADTLSDEIVEATLRNTGTVFEPDVSPEDTKGGYFFSDDRARFIAENEANVVFNYEQYREAVRNGYAFKQWITMKDERVRHTHSLVDGAIVRIDEFFQVGEALLRYPKDLFYGANYPEEIVNCRCTINYMTEEDFREILRTT